MLDRIVVGGGIVLAWVVSSFWYLHVLTRANAPARVTRPPRRPLGAVLVACLLLAAAAIGWGVAGLAIGGCTSQQRQDARSALEIASLICGQAETVTRCLDRVVPVDAPPASASCPIGDAGAPKPGRDY